MIKTALLVAPVVSLARVDDGSLPLSFRRPFSPPRNVRKDSAAAVLGVGPTVAEIVGLTVGLMVGEIVGLMVGLMGKKKTVSK